MRLFSTAVAAAVLLNLPGLALAQEASVPTDNAEMAAIFVADQAVRQNIDPARFRDRAFVEQMNADDAARRERTRALLDAGVPNLAEQDARLEQFRVARQAAAPQP